MATLTNNNVVGSCSSTTNHDHAHTMINKRKRDDALGGGRRIRIRNNNWGKQTSHSSSYLFTPSYHDYNDVCLCLSLSCRLCTAHDDQKKKTCNDDDAAVVGKHNNLQLLQPIDDSTVCLHFSLASPSSCSCCDQIAKKQKHGDQECNAVGDQQWEIKKVLETSDIRPDYNRLMLNKDLADKFVIPHLLGGAKAALEKDGVQVQVWDIDTNSDLSLPFRIWAKGKSHVFTKAWIKKFVERRELKKGDLIGLRWNQLKNCFDFSVLQQPI